MKDFYESLEEIPYATYITVANKAENETNNKMKMALGSKIKHFEKYSEYDCMVVTGFRKSLCPEEDWKHVIDYLLKRLGMTLSEDRYELLKMEKETDNYGVAVKLNLVAKAVRFWQTVIDHPGHKGNIIKNHYQITLTNWKEWESSNQQAMPRTYAIVRGFAGELSEASSRLHILSEWVNKSISKKLIVIFGNVTQNLKDEDDLSYIDNESIAYVYGSPTKEEEGKFFASTKRTGQKPGTARCGCFMYEFYNTIGQMVFYQFASRRTLTAMAVYEFKRIDERFEINKVYNMIENKFPTIDWIFPNRMKGELSYFAIFRDAGPQSLVDLSDLKYDGVSETPTMVRACFTPGVVSLLERRRLRIKMYTETSVKSPWLTRHGEEDSIDGVLPAPPGRIFKSWSSVSGTKRSAGPAAAGAYATPAPSSFYDGASANASTDTDRSAWDSGVSASSNPSRGVYVPAFNPPKKMDHEKGRSSEAVVAPTRSGDGVKVLPAADSRSTLTLSTANTRLQAELRAANEKIQRFEAEKEELKKMGLDTPSDLTLSTKNTRLEAEMRALFDRLKTVEAELAVERYKRTEAEEALATAQEERRADNARMLKMEQQVQFLMQAQMGAQLATMQSPGTIARGPLEKEELEEGEVESSAISESPKKRPALRQEENGTPTTPTILASVLPTASVAETKVRPKAISRRQRKTTSIPFPKVEMQVEADPLSHPSATANRFAALAEHEQESDTVMEMEVSLPAMLEEVAITDLADAALPAASVDSNDIPSQHMPIRFAMPPMKDGEVPESASSIIELESRLEATQSPLDPPKLNAMETDEVLSFFRAEEALAEIFGAMEQPFISTRTGIPYHFNGIEIAGVDILEYATQGEAEPYIAELARNPHQILVKPSNDLGLDGAGSYTIPLGMGAFATVPIPAGSTIVFESKPITSLEFIELQRTRATNYVMQSGQVLHDAAEARKKGDLASAINNSVNVWSRYWNRPARNHCTLVYSPQMDCFSYKVTRAIQPGEEIYAAYASTYHMKRHIEDSRTPIPTPINQPFSKLAQERFVAAARKVQAGINGLTVSLIFDPEAEEVIEELMIATYCHDEVRARKFLQEQASYKLTMLKPSKDSSAKLIARNGQCGADSIFCLYCKQHGINWPKDWAARKQALASYLNQINDLLDLNPGFLKLTKEEQRRTRDLLDKNIRALQSGSGLSDEDYLPNWTAMLFAVDVRLTLWEPRDDALTLTMTMHNLQGSPFVKYAQLSELSKCQHALKLANSHFEPIISPSLDLFPSVVDSLIQALFARYDAKTSVEI